MSYAFSDQQSKLSSLLGDSNTDTDSMFPITQRKKEINRGEWQFAVDALDLKEYATSTVSSGQIALPSDWIQTHILIVNNIVINLVPRPFVPKLFYLLRRSFLMWTASLRALR